MNMQAVLKAMDAIRANDVTHAVLCTIDVEPVDDDMVRLTATDGRAFASIVANRASVERVAMLTGFQWIREGRGLISTKAMKLIGEWDHLGADDYPAWRKVVPLALRSAYQVAKAYDTKLLARLLKLQHAVTGDRTMRLIWNADSISPKGVTLRVDGPNIYMCMPILTGSEEDRRDRCDVASVDLGAVLGRPVSVEPSQKGGDE